MAPIPPRPAYTRKPSSAEFQGALKTPSTSAQETITGADGKSVLVTTTQVAPGIPSSVSLADDGVLGVVATLFYHHSHPGAQDEHYGAFVSDAAISDFVQTVDRLSVPYTPLRFQHRALCPAPSRVVEIAFSSPANLSLTDLRRHEEIHLFEARWNVEVVLQLNNVHRTHKRLAVFDMDSTLIQQEVIDEIASLVGKQEEVASITASAMRGELDFEASLRRRVGLLRGVTGGVWGEVRPRLTFMPGARELTRALRCAGYKLAVLSGGFLPLAEWVKEELGLDYAFANQLVVSEDGKELTGELHGMIVHAEQKAVLLEKIAEENGIMLEQVVAVGDGANDLKMMAKAGLGVAFHAKPLVQERAPCRVNTESLRDVLFILGFAESEQEELLRD